MKGLLAALLFLGPSLEAQQLELRFLNVGQADAALIREGGKTALIDAGSAGVTTYLRALGIDTIDLVVASHNHADHIGGMTGVLDATVVRFYLDNGVPHTTATYQRTIQAVQASGAQYLRPTARRLPSPPRRSASCRRPPAATRTTRRWVFWSNTVSSARSSPAIRSSPSSSTG